jgi:hypothetical protein
LKQLEENIEKILEDLAIGKYILNRIPVIQEIRGRNDK